jgi:hypothetical protein
MKRRRFDRRIVLRRFCHTKNMSTVSRLAVDRCRVNRQEAKSNVLSFVDVRHDS